MAPQRPLLGVRIQRRSGDPVSTVADAGFPSSMRTRASPPTWNYGSYGRAAVGCLLAWAARNLRRARVVYHPNPASSFSQKRSRR
ncbi:hypothetical protein ABZP36_006969 [Zizania latifolia]